MARIRGAKHTLSRLCPVGWTKHYRIDNSAPTYRKECSLCGPDVAARRTRRAERGAQNAARRTRRLNGRLRRRENRQVG
jgi:hypothetical protein